MSDSTAWTPGSLRDMCSQCYTTQQKRKVSDLIGTEVSVPESSVAHLSVGQERRQRFLFKECSSYKCANACAFVVILMINLADTSALGGPGPAHPGPGRICWRRLASPQATGNGGI